MEHTIKIKVGDKVIRADGLAGKVVEVYEISYEKATATAADIKYEDGTHGTIQYADIEKSYKDFYLIGTTILGNKRPIEELDDRIADTHQEIEQLKAREKQLRKQRWRLEYQMNPDLYKPQDGKSDNEED